MDSYRFDRIARSVATGGTRRQFMAALGGAVAGFTALADRAGAVCSPGGWYCQRNSDCCSGACYINSRNRFRRVCCTPNPDVCAGVHGEVDNGCGVRVRCECDEGTIPLENGTCCERSTDNCAGLCDTSVTDNCGVLVTCSTPIGMDCCDRRLYDLATQDCCIVTVIDKATQGCCGGFDVYDKATTGCCLQTRYDLATQECCVFQPYNPDTHACCQGIDLYDPTTHACCDGIDQNNGGVYDPATHGCCAGVICVDP